MAGSNFLKIIYAQPEPRAANLRVGDHDPAVPGLSPEDTEIQASRCVRCDAPGCNSGCPVGQDIPSFLKAVEYGNWMQAHQVAVKSPLYGIFGRICPQDEGLCQTHCTVAKVTSFGSVPGAVPVAPIHNTIAIGPVERAIWDRALSSGWLKYPTPTHESGKSVAIIGAGPAGIYAAIALREKGHDVTLIDSQYEIGGLLLRGIPTFKLAKHDLPIVRKAMEDSGIKFQLNTKVGNSPDGLTLPHLLKDHDAVLVTIGTDRARDVLNPDTGLPIPGSSHIVPALNFLYAHGDAAVRGLPIDKKFNVKGKRVVIIGNGDTAADCIGETARQDQAKKIVTLQRSKKTTGSYKDKKLRFEEAKAIGKDVEALREVLPMELKEKFTLRNYFANFFHLKFLHKDNFVLTVVDKDNQIRSIPCDLVINAAGFEKPNLDEIFGVRTRDHKNLFVAGDALNGATLAVEAAQSGREAAWNVNHYLRQLRL